MTVAFVITALIIVATPGTGALYTISTGLTGGTRAGLVQAAYDLNGKRLSDRGVSQRTQKSME